MPISSDHHSLFHQSNTSDKITLFQSLMDSESLNSNEALALLNTIHAELEQSRGDRAMYIRYAELMESLRKRMPDVYQSVSSAWQALREAKLMDEQEKSPRQGSVDDDSGNEQFVVENQKPARREARPKMDAPAVSRESATEKKESNEVEFEVGEERPEVEPMEEDEEVKEKGEEKQAEKQEAEEEKEVKEEETEEEVEEKEKKEEKEEEETEEEEVEKKEEKEEESEEEQVEEKEEQEEKEEESEEESKEEQQEEEHEEIEHEEAAHEVEIEVEEAGQSHAESEVELSEEEGSENELPGEPD